MIENGAILTDHGNRVARSSLIEVCEGTLTRIHPESLVMAQVERDDNTLVVDGKQYDLADLDRIFVIGAGKGSAAVVDAVRGQIGDQLTDGVVVEKHGQATPIAGVSVVEAGHPIPDESGLTATESVLALADRADENDLVIVCITGGTSAQLVAPPDGVSLVDLATLTESMLYAGLPIEEINAVRKHVSSVKGGRLLERILPATCISLVTVDEVAGEPWGPTVLDETTYKDAVEVLRKRSLWDAAPKSIRAHLKGGLHGAVTETPGPSDIQAARGQTVVLAGATDLCDAAMTEAEQLGFNATVLSSVLEGESRTVGTVLAAVAREIAERDRPIETPCVVISGGETTVTVEDEAGRGGPNQELALQFAIQTADRDDLALMAIGTDGTDGPTDIAGGLVDGTTAGRALERNISLFDHVHHHDSSPALEELGDAVRTGTTGTNVMDLRLLLIE